MGLIRKRPAHIGQKVHDIGIALRLVLHYVAQRGSMRMTTTVAAVAGIVSISQPALFKWMCKIGAYLEALVARMVEPGRYASEAWGGYVLIAADATTVVRPGAKGTTARLHYALHLSDLRPRACAHHQQSSHVTEGVASRPTDHGKQIDKHLADATAGPSRIAGPPWFHARL
jgi:hypothetical protein